jgi:hypothetical protein
MSDNNTWASDPSVAAWLNSDDDTTASGAGTAPAHPIDDTPADAYSAFDQVRGGGGADAPTEQFRVPDDVLTDPMGQPEPTAPVAEAYTHLGLAQPAPAGPHRGRQGRLRSWVGQYRWPLTIVAAAVAAVLVAVIVLGLSGNSSSTPTPSGDGIAIPSGAASSSAAPAAASADCPTRTQGPVSSGRDGGGTGNGVDVIKAFEHAYYVERSGAKARALVTPSAKFSTAEQLQASIDSSIDPETLHCVSITDRGTGLYAVDLTETPPRGETPVTYHQLIQTTTDQGRTWIVSIVKNPAAPTS